MQFDRREYDPILHDLFKAITIHQPEADAIIPLTNRKAQSVHFRARPTQYRGEIVICSSMKPEVPGYLMGCALGFAELVDVRPVGELSDAELGGLERPAKGYAYIFRNPRRAVEIPVSGHLGVFDLILPKGELMEYPRAVSLDERAWNGIKQLMSGQKKKGRRAKR